MILKLFNLKSVLLILCALSFGVSLPNLKAFGKNCTGEAFEKSPHFELNKAPPYDRFRAEGTTFLRLENLNAIDLIQVGPFMVETTIVETLDGLSLEIGAWLIPETKQNAAHSPTPKKVQLRNGGGVYLILGDKKIKIEPVFEFNGSGPDADFAVDLGIRAPREYEIHRFTFQKSLLED